MIPNLWRCGPSPALDVIGALLHPVGLLLLLGVWSVLSLVGPRSAAAVVGRLLYALTAQSVALAAILCGFALTVGQLTDPTGVIEGLQFVAGVLSWVSAVAVLRSRPLPRWLTPPVTRTVESARRRVALALSAAVVSAFWLCIFLAPPISKGNVRYLLTASRWLFEVTTTRIASDECLAVRALVLRPGGRATPPPASSPPPRHGDVCCLGDVFPDPASDAAAVLTKRGPSAAPAVAWALEGVLARDNWVEQERAVRLVRELARWTGGHPLLDAWADSAFRPPGQQLVRNWRVCARLNRRDRMGRDVDDDCMYLKH
jgi:hypothetical protein